MTTTEEILQSVMAMGDRDRDFVAAITAAVLQAQRNAQNSNEKGKVA